MTHRMFAKESLRFRLHARRSRLVQASKPAMFTVWRRVPTVCCNRARRAALLLTAAILGLALSATAGPFDSFLNDVKKSANEAVKKAASDALGTSASPGDPPNQASTPVAATAASPASSPPSGDGCANVSLRALEGGKKGAAYVIKNNCKFEVKALFQYGARCLPTLVKPHNKSDSHEMSSGKLLHVCRYVPGGDFNTCDCGNAPELSFDEPALPAGAEQVADDLAPGAIPACFHIYQIKDQFGNLNPRWLSYTNSCAQSIYPVKKEALAGGSCVKAGNLSPGRPFPTLREEAKKYVFCDGVGSDKLQSGTSCACGKGAHRFTIPADISSMPFSKDPIF
jgi:hypothetical protein